MSLNTMPPKSTAKVAAGISANHFSRKSGMRKHSKNIYSHQSTDRAQKIPLIPEEDTLPVKIQFFDNEQQAAIKEVIKAIPRNGIVSRNFCCDYCYTFRPHWTHFSGCGVFKRELLFLLRPVFTEHSTESKFLCYFFPKRDSVLHACDDFASLRKFVAVSMHPRIS
eukprot:GHVP01069967.1.p1 GENE.GHVP01069967.1~~GHVP01069967.1.p1  ORF type:complete len:166 (-),score=23.86 GHVP01069967.1:440-937(-)